MSLQPFEHQSQTGGGKIINFAPAEFLKLFEDTRHALDMNPENASSIALGFFRRIASSDRSIAFDGQGGLAPWQKRKIERYLKTNLERSVRMEELAGEVRLSVSHFCRAFKKSFGDTPHAYVIRLRLELARKLMLATDDPLSQIALSCGLADQAHLSKLFRRIFHDTPNAWRRRNLSDAQAGDQCRSENPSVRRAA